MRKSWTGFEVLGGVLLLVGGVLIAGGVAKPKANASNDAALNEKIISYVRERYGIPDTVKVTATPFQSSNFPGFLASTITTTTDDGKEPRNTTIFLTDDRHYLIVGFLFALSGDPKGEIVQHVREQFKIPEATSLTVGPFRNSSFPNFLTTTVALENGKQKQTEDFYITKDNRTLVLGRVFNLGQDLRREALRAFVTTNQPTQGPAHAPVTIVEYADLECPMCGRLHEFLEKELIPKYGDKVRVIFKEFPLVQIHDWALTAAIANECVYEIKPEAYAPYRSLIFQNQSGTNAANVRDALMGYADQVGVDRVRLAGCLDSKASLPRVDEGTREAKRLEIQSTPTCFINGRMLVGFPNAEAYYKAVDAALKEAK
ncbi:MAG: thioredoxin domain-containing protein [Terriglobia bacterium]|jgi:protein-disulfide isomerase